jgi:hypothetical protein
MKTTKRGPLTTCPSCQAVLSPDQAVRLPTLPGYVGALGWPHRRPDTGAKCFISSGPAIAPAAPAEASADTRSQAGQEETDGAN